MSGWQKFLLNQAKYTLMGLLSEGVMNAALRKAITPTMVQIRDVLNAFFAAEPVSLSPAKAQKAVKSFKLVA